MGIGERIKTRREELRLSQDELAKMLGYKSRSSINKIELGKNDITQHKVVAFAKALQTTPAYLMGWVESTDSEKKNDTIADIILKLRSDSNYLELCSNLQNLNPEQLEAVKTFLTVFQKQDIN